MMKAFGPPSMVMVHSLESRCQSGCQIVVRVVVSELLSERLLSEWPLPEWLLSVWPRSEWQSGWSAVRLVGSQAGRQSKSVTKFLHSPVLVINTARNLSNRQTSHHTKATPNPSGQPRKCKQRTQLWTQKRHPKMKNPPRTKISTDQKVKSIETAQINQLPFLQHYIDQSQQTGVPVAKFFQSMYHLVDQHRHHWPHWQHSGEPPARIPLVVSSSAMCYQSTD